MKLSFIFVCLVTTLLTGCFISGPSEKLMNQSSCKFDKTDPLKIVNGKGIIEENFVILEFSKLDKNQVVMKVVPSNVTLVVPVTEKNGFLWVNLDGQEDFVKCKL